MKKLLLLLLLALPTIGEAQMCMQWELVCKDLPYDGQTVLVWVETDTEQYWEKVRYEHGHFLGNRDVTPYVTNWMQIYPPAAVCPAPTPPEPDGGPLE